MNGFVANTDFDWYEFLRDQRGLDEVNFWQPSGGRAFRVLQPGEPFFFKLKSPHYAVAGYGFFARFSVLPAWLAWESFTVANGAPSHAEMLRRIQKYRPADRRDPAGQYEVGCIMISAPVFFARDAWVEQPRDWHRNVVQGATYDLAAGEGRRLWDDCRQRTGVSRLEAIRADTGIEDDGPRYGSEIVVRPRLGQGTFRVAVIDAYQRACAVTGEHSLPALEAAHIRPYANEGRHEVANGLLLRSDIHRLFDHGYVTVTPDIQFEVSRRLKEDYENGRTYYPLAGRRIAQPPLAENRPRVELLRWHNDNVFLG